MNRMTGITCKVLTLLLLATRLSGADITFFSLSDTHYGALQGSEGDKPKVRSSLVEVINSLAGTSYPSGIGGVVAPPRGILMQGDLINDGARDELRKEQWKNYVADFGVNGEGRCRFPVFEGLGNHDLGGDNFVFKRIRERNQQRMQLGYITGVSTSGYHCSWDWDGIHFVNLNLFPGNGWHGEADSYGPAHNPMRSRAFLERDLSENVGDSGRPVIIMHHFRVIDENWWTYTAADRYHKVLQDYNVAAIIVGHQGGGLNNLWRGYNWISSNGELVVVRVTPDNMLTAIERKADRWGALFQKKIFFSYRESGLPAVINNGDWASGITTTGAKLSGKVLYKTLPETEVTVFWGTTDGGTDSARWEHSEKLGVMDAGKVFYKQVDGLPPATMCYYRCRAENSQGEAWAQSSISFTTSGRLPEGWNTAFIGYEQRPGGGAHCVDGSFEVKGSGRDIAESGQAVDNFQFAWRSLSGDGEISCRLVSVDGRTREPKAGIMLRESALADARNVALLFSPRRGLRFTCRKEGASSSRRVGSTEEVSMPCWLKLRRQGDILIAYGSEDGKSWLQVGDPVMLDLPDKILWGLAVTAGNRDGSGIQSSRFDDVSIEKK